MPTRASASAAAPIKGSGPGADTPAVLLRPDSLPPGIALDERGEPQLDWVAGSRYGGAMFVCAGVLGLLSLALPNADDLVPVVAVASSLTALVLGVIGILLRDRLGALGVCSLSAIGVACVSVFALYGHR